MSCRVFIAKPPSFSELEAFVADLVHSGNAVGPPLQTLKAKCRELARAESAILVSPTSQSLSHPFGAEGQLSLWIVAKKDAVNNPKVTARLQQLSIKLSHRVRVSHGLIQTCYQFTVIARLAPKWNQVTHWLIKGSDFLSTGKAQAINFEVGVNNSEVTLNLVVNKLSFSPLKPEDLHPTSTVLQSFRSNPDSVITETSIYSNRCILLPNFSSGYVYSASHQFPSSAQFPSYDRIRLHWKKQHGIVLPEKQDLFYQVFFKMNSTNFFSYPGCCVFKTLPTSFPSREADSVTAAFIADVHARVPAICGTSLRYSNKAHTPLVTLQTAVGCGASVKTAQPTNLKPVELIPELDLTQFPIPPSMTMAALPRESASFGREPCPIASQQPLEKCGQSDLAHSSTSQPGKNNNTMSSTVKQSTRSSVLNDASGQPVTHVNHHSRQLITPHASVLPPGERDGGKGVVSCNGRLANSGGPVARTTNPALPKVVPQFGGKRAETNNIQQSLVEKSAVNTHPRTLSLMSIGSRGDPTNGQPPQKKARLSLQHNRSTVSQRVPPTSKNTASQPTADQSAITPVNDLTHRVNSLTSDLQNSVQQQEQQLAANEHRSFNQPGVSDTSFSLASSHVNGQVVDKNMNRENRQVADTSGQNVVTKPTAEKSGTMAQHKEAVLKIDGVSDSVIKKISKCKVAVLRKWLQENGVRCRSKDKKDDLIRLVATHLLQTGKSFDI